jgi:hypothetical protein
MSDHSDVEEFETADAGASTTVPMQAGSVRKGGFMVIKGRPTKVRLRGNRAIPRRDHRLPRVSPAPAVVPPTPGRLVRENPRERNRRVREEPEPPERRRSPRRGRPPSTVSVRALAPSRGFFVVLFSPVRCGKNHTPR